MTTSSADPRVNATVFASAGTGKTWLLVARLLRLLLAGVRPEGILAVTFTRAAAGEMRLRLVERLREWAVSDDEALDSRLRGIGIEKPDAALRERARALYEETLFAARGVKAMTFHAFCQDLLRRFPLEAEVPPGFELAQETDELLERARDALFTEAARKPGGDVAAALETLFERTGTADSAVQALRNFIDHRSDWWAFTEGEDDPVAFARERLAQDLDVDETADPIAAFVAAHRDDLVEFAALLGKGTANEKALADPLAAALADDDTEAAFAAARPALLTKTREPRARKASKAQRERLGAEAEMRFLSLHEDLCAAMLDALDRRAARDNLAVNRAWYLAGQRLLDHFQRIKQELRTLDFADLEWRACRLLNETDHAQWVQYKLDARIDHLLVDEFQDTNPTQWRLLKPLLEEMAAGDPERTRSVFLVGDSKQSIYGFRRANPALQDTAAKWLQAHLDGRSQPLGESRRSSPAIIDFVNVVFGDGAPLSGRLAHFEPHTTHRTALWGRVEIHPPCTAVKMDREDARLVLPLRDSLTTPRTDDEADSAHALEAELVARRIGDAMTESVIGEGDKAHRPTYSDILILVRNRTHVRQIEQALRRAGIPFASADRGTLLEQLEVDDIVKLLTLLVAPFDDLALAQVLKSPIFALSDNDLVRIAQAPGRGWWARLQTLATATPLLQRAARLLVSWRALAGRLPIHDLLDRIYHEGDVLARYRAASREERRSLVESSLIRLHELALEVDSGRYPSLSRFLARLKRLRLRSGDDAPDIPASRGDTDRVRIMTVHGAKGLQAPIVFLCNARFPGSERNAWKSLVAWPAGDDHPSQMCLLPKKEDCCRRIVAVLEARRQDESREDANLLYVAMTRAEQILIVTAAATDKAVKESWHEAMRAAVDERLGTTDDDGTWSHEFGTPPAAAIGKVTTQPAQDLAMPPPIHSSAHGRSREAITRAEAVAQDSDALCRGTAIHRFLDLLTRDRPAPEASLIVRVGGELGLAPADARLVSWLNEARAVRDDDALADLFRPDRYDAAWNEVPIACRDADGRLRHGIMDRLVRYGDRLLLVDYKTHRIDDEAALRSIAEGYREQMGRYRAGASQLWPGTTIECLLLFTASRHAVRVDTSASGT